MSLDWLAAGGALPRQREIERRAEHGARHVRRALEARNDSDPRQFIHRVALAVTLSRRTEIVTEGAGTRRLSRETMR
jgi:hypothetical protein